MYFTYSTAQNYVRVLTQGVTLSDNRKMAGDYKRSLVQTAEINSLLTRYSDFLLKIKEIVKGLDSNTSSFLFLRAVHETVKSTDLLRQVAAYTRGLSDTAEIEDKAKSGRAFFTIISDTVQVAGSVFRGLLIYVRIVNGVFIRDYLLSRFLKARQELVLKSAICREIILESKIE
jgi:hypothetical protein